MANDQERGIQERNTFGYPGVTMSTEPASQTIYTAPEPSTVTSLRRRNRATVLKQIILARETTRATIRGWR
jgi:hypothetical protein